MPRPARLATPTQSQDRGQPWLVRPGRHTIAHVEGGARARDRAPRRL